MVLYTGYEENLPVASYIFYTFNDSQSELREMNWTAQDNGSYLDVAKHKFLNFGTYFINVLLMNNVSSLSFQKRVEVEQCVDDLRLSLLNNTRY